MTEFSWIPKHLLEMKLWLAEMKLTARGQIWAFAVNSYSSCARKFRSETVFHEQASIAHLANCEEQTL